MASTFRLQSGWRYASGSILAVCACLGIVYVRAWESGAASSAIAMRHETPNQVQRNSSANLEPTSPWSVFIYSQVRQGFAPSVVPTERFRLAGTFAIESSNGSRIQKAVLDDTQENLQNIVGEGDTLGDVVVENIRHDRITIRSATATRELVMEFVSIPSATIGGSTSNSLGELSAAASNRLGCIKVQDGRWQFSRQPMLDYYQQLLDEPDRMVALFDTMKPVRDSQNKITGYVVGVEGEKEFFDVVGLREGDIVRQVNSVAMTNRRRAEFFIDEFLKNRMSAIVLDVERDGKVQKQIYQVKE